ncbi:hypothetical protein ACIRD3_03365 [Kitasatospora sp. NPDC093550]|uniref:hypothetical protein n=1 Tax=Kitasatospora sp. NPDC093550 TaxID=3364089 RepID=UPI003821E81D
MTHYSVDPDRHALIASWGTGDGHLATHIGLLPADAPASTLKGLSRALTQLSEAAWRAYTHPAGAADSPAPGPAGRPRGQDRDHFGGVAEAIARPGPAGGRVALVSRSHLLESAHRVGRTLGDLADPVLTEAVLAEAATELGAVESAELGDLSGRAQQAVLLSREDASPVQVAAADRLLEQDPFGPAELFSTVDPTAAAVAAAHWLAAAAEVTAQASGHDPVQVVQEADRIEPLPHETPTIVLRLIQAGVLPHDAVTDLVRHAMRIAEGLLPIPITLRDQADADAPEEPDETVAEYEVEDAPGLGELALRLTPLDPRRPARDLLEVLVAGIRACWLLHSEYGGLGIDAEDRDDEQDAPRRRSRERFARLVRATAAHHRNRLV